ncbi:hypothetical protein [Bradyrhizobium sp. 45]|nr:hypothetical protein [Bradyrhizobium sp. 45]MCK1304613.1 hypothetical protein [Bradyrhizobium sp. 45]
MTVVLETFCSPSFDQHEVVVEATASSMAVSRTYAADLIFSTLGHSSIAG